ncbi:MAG: hypothetical protein WD043_12580 [Gemmatimonadales bacterium]
MPGLTVAITGATGMIGAGVLAECLSDRRIDTVIAIGRTPLGHSHSKVREHLQHDFLHWPGPTSVFQHVDAVFFCLGVSAIGLNEAEYHRITYDYTLATARAAPGSRSVMSRVKAPMQRNRAARCGHGSRGKQKTPCSPWPVSTPTLFAPGTSSPAKACDRKRAGIGWCTP